MPHCWKNVGEKRSLKWILMYEMLKGNDREWLANIWLYLQIWTHSAFFIFLGRKIYFFLKCIIMGNRGRWTRIWHPFCHIRPPYQDFVNFYQDRKKWNFLFFDINRKKPIEPAPWSRCSSSGVLSEWSATCVTPSLGGRTSVNSSLRSQLTAAPSLRLHTFRRPLLQASGRAAPLYMSGRFAPLITVTKLNLNREMKQTDFKTKKLKKCIFSILVKVGKIMVKWSYMTKWMSYSWSATSITHY